MLASTTDALNTKLRRDLDDVIPSGGTDDDKLWKEEDVYSYMTEAADAVARDVEGIYRKFQLVAAADQQIVPLSPAVLHIRKLRSLTTGRYLEPANINDDNRIQEDYGLSVSGGDLFTSRGTPSVYIRDYEKCALLLGPIPAVADTFEMQCTATIAVPLVVGMPLPFMQIPDQALMLLYMKHLAYAKHDANTLDLAKSKDFKTQYDAAALDRKTKLLSYRRTPRSITPDW